MVFFPLNLFLIIPTYKARVFGSFLNLLAQANRLSLAHLSCFVIPELVISSAEAGQDDCGAVLCGV
jgi:hypothetical protein